MLTDSELLQKLRKDISFVATLRNRDYKFCSTWGLFSPREIDAGTRLLLKHIDINSNDNCLDLGCGYGPIGLVMATEASDGETILLDKDFVAIDYSTKNLQLQRIENAKALLSNGFDAVTNAGQWNLIASNIPAKVGKEMLTIYLHDAFKLLAPGGRFYVVTVNGLRQYMKRNLTEVFGNYKKLKQGSNYTVALAYKASD